MVAFPVHVLIFMGVGRLNFDMCAVNYTTYSRGPRFSKKKKSLNDILFLKRWKCHGLA